MVGLLIFAWFGERVFALVCGFRCLFDYLMRVVSCLLLFVYCVDDRFACCICCLFDCLF